VDEIEVREVGEELFARSRGLGAELMRRRLAGETVGINPGSADLLPLLDGLIGLVNELGMRYLGLGYPAWLAEVETAGHAADVVLQARAALQAGQE